MASSASSAWGIGVAVHQGLAADWDLFARLGVARMTTKVNLTVADPGPWSASAINDVPYGGQGMGWCMWQDVALELYWDTVRTRYNKNGADLSATLNMRSLGLPYKF